MRLLRQSSHVGDMAQNSEDLTRSTHWTDVIVICRKCGKKLKGGFGDDGKQGLKTVLRQALRQAGRRRDVRVIETKCLGVCPRDGVTALNASRPGLLHIVPAGLEREAVVRVLLGLD